jgi:hypothetical protein
MASEGEGLGLAVAIATIVAVPLAIFGIWVQHRDTTAGLARPTGSPTKPLLASS